MRKTFLKVSLLAVLGLGMSASFTSCKDYDSEINDLTTKYNALQKAVDDINALVKSGSVITAVSQNGQGVTFTLSNGQSYTVTNGKDGQNGAPGKDADVWTIVKNAEGALVWAKNGEATEFPAQGPQGPAGANGTSGTTEPGIYYVPNEDGYFYKVDPAKGTEEKTDISWKAKGGISAVATGDKVILSGLIDAEGNTAEDLTIWRSMFVKGLVAIPEFYLDGIEATRYEVIKNHRVQKTNVAEADVDVPAATSSLGAVILKGQPLSFGNRTNPANGNQIWYSADQIATLGYHVNPSNAVTEGMQWNLLIDDKEVINRSSAVYGEVLETSGVDADGDITITYQLSGTDRLAPYSGLATRPTSNPYWTMMALQAANPETDSALVASGNVAIIKRSVKLVHLLVSQNGASNDTWYQTWDQAAFATAEIKNDPILNGATAPTPAVVLEAPYNQVYDLKSRIAIETSYLDNMIDGQIPDPENEGEFLPAKDNLQTTSGEYTSDFMSLADAEKKYNLTTKYQLVAYTIKPNQTSEDKFAKINADNGMVTPCWVSPDGKQNEIPGTTNEGRSAIGRQPMVYVTLNNAAGQIVLAGFVKIKYVEPAVQLPSIILNKPVFPYNCTNGAGSTWEQITGAVYEAIGVTPEQFSKSYLPTTGIEDGNYTYKPEANDLYQPLIFMAPDKLATFKNLYGKDVNASVGFAGLATLSWDSNPNDTHTQKLGIHITDANYAAWYPTWNNNGTHKGYSVTTAPQTRTLYARFYNATENKTVYIGFEVTLTGAPAASYEDKLASQWTSDLSVAPINPAVPGQTTATSPVQALTKYPYAAAMAMNFKSVWKGGLPVPTDKNYNFTNPNSEWNYINPNTIKANYTFAKPDPKTIIGLSGTEYTLSVSKNSRTLLATWEDENGDEQTEPIAAISQDNGDATATPAVPPMYDVISMLPYFEVDADNNAIVPITGTATYGTAACDIVNSEAFNKENPAITFDVLMSVSYGVCNLNIPDSYALEVGVGCPISLRDKNGGSLQDAVNGKVLASKLFTMADWQGHALWNVGRTGTVTKNQFNGVNLDEFWFSQGDFAGSIATVAPNYTDYGLTIDLGNAEVSNDPDQSKGVLGKFSTVYVDKKLTITNNAANAVVDATANTVTVKDATDLDDVEINWVNNGSAVTSNIYVFVPVKVTYVWGQNMTIGWATITIEPTLSE